MSEFTFDGFEPANTTPVPDVLFDKLLPHLNEAQLKVMLYIIRRTLGFKKTSDAISLKQFRYGITTKDGKKLDEGCGLKNYTSIIKALNALEQMGCMESEKKETDDGDAATTVYRVHFRGTARNGVPTTRTVVPTARNGGRVLRETEDGVLRETESQETVIQETVIQEGKNDGALVSENQQDALTHPSTPSLSSQVIPTEDKLSTTSAPASTPTESSPEEKRIQGYWKQLGFIVKPNEHWSTLSEHIQSFEQFKLLFKYTETALKDKPNKRVYPGNLVDSLDGWKQELARAKKLEKSLERKSSLDPIARYREVGARFMSQGAN